MDPQRERQVGATAPRDAPLKPSSSMVSYIEQDESRDDLEGDEVVEDKSTCTQVDTDIDPDNLKGSFLSGPKTNQLLKNYRHHITYEYGMGRDE
ncbi:hypothetical protein QJS10_CPA10g00975 [Acorus calamus]|uniref:Uncharacterized protein n=1 Tax=Acorus calamus TaxID=4465 RepID=A0AAV9DZP9_ACOCL|nr:hypothetical protein QJS10_CPA10g00975 [Acorus calamus]